MFCVIRGLALAVVLAQFGPLAAQQIINIPAKEDPGNIIVMFGDSISAGYGLRPGESFPDEVQRRLTSDGLRWRVVNMGISGDTTAGGAARINTALAQKPAIVVLELGGNDGLRGVPLATTRSNMEKMIVGFQSAGARVILAGMTLPPNYGQAYVQGFEKIYTDLAAKYRLNLIPFIFSDIITPDLRYFQADHVHPTADGARIIAGTVLRTLRPLLMSKN